MQPPDSDWEELMGADIRVKFLKKCPDKEIASYGMTVTCNVKCSLSTTGDLIEDLSDQRYKIGEGDAVPGLELPLRHSRVGDQFLVQCSSKFAYGPTGRPAISDPNKSISTPSIPPDADLTFEVVILQHQNEEDLQVGTREHAKFVLSVRKECGNRWFSHGDFNRAARAYSKGAEAADGYLKSIVEGNDDASLALMDESTVVELYLACLNNLAACYLNKNENVKAKEVCIRILELDPRNIKGLLRAARAALALFEFEETEACLKRVLELEPSNTVAANEFSKLRAARRKYADSSKEMARKMTKKLFPNEAPARSTTASSASGSEQELPKTKTESDSTSSQVDPGLEATKQVQTTKDQATKDQASVDQNDKLTAPHEPARAYSVFILLFSSLAVVVVSIVIALFARNTNS